MKTENKMKKWIIVIVCMLFIACLYVHRRVIKAILMHEEMPKAPSWHIWVPQNARRG